MDKPGYYLDSGPTQTPHVVEKSSRKSTLNSKSPSIPAGQSHSPLIFLNSSNPVKDSKERKHKKLISRWAVINSLRFPQRVDSRQGSLTPTGASDSNSKNNSGHGSDQAPLRRGNFFHVSPGGTPYRHDTTSPYNGPAELLSSTPKDPFDTLPFKADDTSWRLLNYWLNAGGYGLEREKYRGQVSRMRKDMCFPLLLDSKATFTAALALFETSAYESFDEAAIAAVEHHLRHALPALQDTLGQSSSSGASHAAIAIVLLMTVAVNTRDIDALRAHFHGLSALISRQPHLITQNPYIMGLVNVWAFSYARAFRPSELPEFLIFDASTCSVHDQIPAGKGVGFEKLKEAGLMSKVICSHIPTMFCVEHLRERARRDRLSPQNASDLLRCVWFQSIVLKTLLDACETVVDKCIRYGMIVCFTLELVLHPTKGLQSLAMALHLQLIKANLSWMLSSMPRLLLWMCLVAGPYTSAETKIWFSQIIVKIREKLGIDSYERARRICEEFIWPPAADKGAYELWSQAFILENPVVDISLLQKSFGRTLSIKATANDRPCAFCTRLGCPNARIEDVPDHVRGMLWAMSVADFRKVCDIEWYEEEEAPGKG